MYALAVATSTVRPRSIVAQDVAGAVVVRMLRQVAPDPAGRHTGIDERVVVAPGVQARVDLPLDLPACSLGASRAKSAMAASATTTRRGTAAPARPD